MHGIWLESQSASTAYDRFYKREFPQIFLKRLTCGTTSVEMGAVFPILTNILREGFTEFGKSMRGYLTEAASCTRI
jgi:hypothetical protein